MRRIIKKVAYSGIIDKHNIFFTKECLKRAVDAFHSTKELLLVTENFDTKKPAVGFLKDLALKGDTLEATIDLTPEGEKLLQDSNIFRIAGVSKLAVKKDGVTIIDEIDNYQIGMVKKEQDTYEGDKSV